MVVHIILIFEKPPFGPFLAPFSTGISKTDVSQKHSRRFQDLMLLQLHTLNFWAEALKLDDILSSCKKVRIIIGVVPEKNCGQTETRPNNQTNRWYRIFTSCVQKSCIWKTEGLIFVTLLHGCFSRFLYCTNGTK